MTREQYARLTGMTRRAVARLPLGERSLMLPTVFTAAAYLGSLFYLFCIRDARLARAVLVPACCFAAVTLLRDVIGRERPYDAFGLPPVGRWKPGKRKSLPSRHAASAAAIALAAVYAIPSVPFAALMGLMAVLIGALRVCAGHHYPSDVLCALALSGVISFVGYCLI